MLKNKFLLMLFALSFVGLSNLNAQDIIRSKSISGIQKTTVSQNSLLINVFGEYPTFLKIYNPKSNQMIDLPAPMVITEAYLNSEVIYGMTSNLNIFINVPFKWINHYSPDLIQKNKGFSDIELGGYLKILGKNYNKSSLIGELSVITPTGESKNLSNAEYPLGEGAWQFNSGISGMYLWKSWNILYSAHYILKTENSSNTNLGDVIFAHFSLEKDIYTSYGDFTFESGFIIRNQFENSNNGKKIDNSNEFGTKWFGGIAFYYLPQIRMSFNVPITIYEKDAWLTDYSIVLKFEYSLHFRN